MYWQRYGAQAVTKDEARSFIRRAVARGRTTTRWAESTIIRVSNYLLGICADYGLLGTMRADARAIIPFRITPVTSSVLAHESTSEASATAPSCIIPSGASLVWNQQTCCRCQRRLNPDPLCSISPIES